MLYAFDLDGTLIDSKPVVLEAYRSVGIEPPSDFFLKTWREWLPDAQKHDEKNKMYLKLLYKIKPLPLLELYRSLEGRCMIMTGASKVAVLAIAKQFGLDTKTTLCQMSIAQKIHQMNIFTSSGIMFEDQHEAAEQMRRETRWTICHTL